MKAVKFKNVEKVPATIMLQIQRQLLIFFFKLQQGTGQTKAINFVMTKLEPTDWKRSDESH